MSGSTSSVRRKAAKESHLGEGLGGALVTKRLVRKVEDHLNPLLADGENFFRRKVLRSSYSIASSPLELSQVDICGKRVSGMAARTWVRDDVIFLSLN